MIARVFRAKSLPVPQGFRSDLPQGSATSSTCCSTDSLSRRRCRRPRRAPSEGHVIRRHESQRRSSRRRKQRRSLRRGCYSLRGLTRTRHHHYDDPDLRPHRRGRRPHDRRLFLAEQTLVAPASRKNGKLNQVLRHQKFEECLDVYINAARTANVCKGPLFRSAIGERAKLSTRPILRGDVWLTMWGLPHERRAHQRSASAWLDTQTRRSFAFTRGTTMTSVLARSRGFGFESETLGKADGWTLTADLSGI